MVIDAKHRYLVSAFLIFTVGLILGWWLTTPNRGSLVLKNPECDNSELNALLKQSTSKDPFVYCPMPSRSELIDRISKQRICIVCSKRADKHQISAPHLFLSPCSNTLILEQIALFKNIGPVLLLIDGLDSLETPDHHEDVFAPALDLLEDLKFPVLILHSIGSKDENAAGQKY